MTSLFDVIDSNERLDRTASRQALALAHKKVAERFDGFLAQRVASADYTSRLELVKDDFRDTVRQACESIGYTDVDGVVHTLWNERLTAAATTSTRTASADEDGFDKEARRPKFCPYHSEVVDASLAAGDPQAGYHAYAQHAWTDKHCKGDEYEGGKCSFKPEMTTKTYWDEKAEKAEERKLERQQQAEQQEEVQDFQTPSVEEIPPEPKDESEGFEITEPSDDGGSESFEGGEATEPQAGLAQEELMAVAASAGRFVPLAPKAAAPLPGLMNDIQDAMPGGKAPGAAQTPTPATGVQPGAAPVPPQIQNGPPALPSANDIHQQFGQIAGDASNGVNHGYNPEAHSQANYDQVAQQMGITPEQVQTGLADFYNRPGGPNRGQPAPGSQNYGDNGNPTPTERGDYLARPTASIAKTAIFDWLKRDEQPRGYNPRNPHDMTGRLLDAQESQGQHGRGINPATFANMMLDRKIAEFVQQGMDPESARAAAMESFNGQTMGDIGYDANIGDPYGRDASVKEAEALEKQKVTDVPKSLPAGTEQHRWRPKNLKTVDSEGEGSPNPTRRKDPVPGIDKEKATNKQELSEVGEQVTEHQDVTQDSSFQGGKANDKTWPSSSPSAVS